MKQISNVQRNLKRIVENYRQYHIEYQKYDTIHKKYILMGEDRKSWEMKMEELKADLNRDEFAQRLEYLQESIYKICKSFQKITGNLDMYGYADDEFIKSIGLDFSIDENARNTGKFYTFYIDNKKIFTKFESHSIVKCDNYLGGLN